MIVWSFWEGIKPQYIDLCFETFKGFTWPIIILNYNELHKYLTKNQMSYVNKINLIEHKSDYIRTCLLFNHGGLWLDADTIVLQPYLLQKMIINSKSDFCGFGNSFLNSKNGYPLPSNGAMYSIKSNKFMKKVINYQENLINNNSSLSYFDLGKKVLWKIIKELNYKYYHFDSWVDGSRDKNGDWINTKNHLDNDPFLFEKLPCIIFLENHQLSKTYFASLEKNQIKESQTFISYYLNNVIY